MATKRMASGEVPRARSYPTLPSGSTERIELAGNLAVFRRTGRLAGAGVDASGYSSARLVECGESRESRREGVKGRESREEGLKRGKVEPAPKVEGGYLSPTKPYHTDRYGYAIMGEHRPLYFNLTGDEEHLPRAPIPPNTRPYLPPPSKRSRIDEKPKRPSECRKQGNVHALPPLPLPVPKDTCQCPQWRSKFWVFFFLIGLIVLLQFVIIGFIIFELRVERPGGYVNPPGSWPCNAPDSATDAPKPKCSLPRWLSKNQQEIKNTLLITNSHLRHLVNGLQCLNVTDNEIDPG